MSIVKSTLQLNSTVQVPSILNFSRSSSATRVNNIGIIETFAANTIRQDYMPDDVGRLMGWLFEEASTNSCLQSAAFDNASWITSTAAQTNKGTIDGDQYKSPDGGQNSDVATEHLNCMNSKYNDLPWNLTFSYGRALQQDALNTWAGKKRAKAQEAFLVRAEANSSAKIGDNEYLDLG